MKSQDSVLYYQHHARKLAERDLRVKNPSELLPFLEMLEPGTSVLDLGCGSGVDLLYIRRAGFEGSGLEASSELASIARIQNPGAEILEKNFLFLTLKESTLGGVANHALDHLEPEMVQRVIAVLFRGLKTSGALGLVVYEGTESYQDRDLDLSGPSRFIHPYSEHAISSMVEQTGFKIKKIGRQPARPEQGHALPSLLVLANKI